MNVAEMICSAPALKLSLNFIVSQCLPEVSKIVKATVDRAIAPRSIAIGDYSPSMKDALTRMAKAQP